MGIQVNWDDEDKSIIRYNLEGLWTWDDYCIAINQTMQLMQDIDHPVGVIANFRADTMVPLGVTHHEDSLADHCPPTKFPTMPNNMDVIVVMGGNYFVEVLLSAFCRLYSRVEKHIFIASSVNEAREIIRTHRPQPSLN